MPIFNISAGSTVEFTVAFYDSAGALATPSSATMTVTYPTDTLTTASTTFGLTRTGSFFTGTWGTAASTLGFATWSVTAPGQSSATSGQIRIID